MKTKKILSVLLCLVMIASLCIPAFFASAEDEAIPIVYLRGRGTELYDDPSSPDKKQIYPLSYPDDYIQTCAKDILPIFAKAVFTNNWDAYCDALYNYVAPVFEEITLDNNGEVSDKSGITWNWSLSSMKDKKKNGKYGLFDYVFKYDWRLDPCVTAEGLNAYIEDVKTVTGSSKVNLVTRCYATNVAVAYLAAYGGDSINNCILYNSITNGAVVCGEAFSGKLALDGDCIERYCNETLGDSTLMELVKATVTLFNKNYTLDITANMVERIYGKIGSNVVPRLLMATFATMPSYWSMVGDEDFEDAKALVFGENKEQYAGLIQKIDNYHYNVQVKVPEILTKCKAEGMNVALVCKYGWQTTPIVEKSDEISDNTILLTDQSFGATCSKIDSTLSEDYIAQAVANGTDKYISPDKQVDASTCLFPDSTWIIKGVDHVDFPNCVDPLLLEIARYNGQMTVNDNELYPQYLLYDADAETITPLTEIEDNTKNFWEDSLMAAFFNFIKALFNYIKEYLGSFGGC